MIMTELETSELRATYRVLGACLALREFAVDDISRFSGIEASECLKIIDGHRQYVEIAAVSGQMSPVNLYRTKPESLLSLRKELDRLREQLPRSPGRDLTKVEEEGEGPEVLGLVVAEHLLTEKWSGATNEERKHLRYDAELAFRGGCRGVGLYANTVVHIAKVQRLLDSAKQELISKGLLS